MFFIKRNCVLFFCFVFALNLKAQDGSKAIALKTILQSIEKQHHVYFNYIENEIVVIKIEPPKRSLSLNDKIVYLEKKPIFYSIKSIQSSSRFLQKKRSNSFVVTYFRKMTTYPKKVPTFKS